jgi:alcohol dehydrogenase
VRFGAGRRREVPEVLSGRRWGILSTPGILAQHRVAEVLDDCHARGVEVRRLGSVSANPRLAEVQEALDAAIRERVEGVVGIGGGSVMDGAKLLRIAYQHGTSAREALLDLTASLRRPVAADCALVVVPTTAGTGAEVSQGAIITDEATGQKLAARGQSLVADAAVIDPELALSLPPARASECAFDIVTHAIETFLSRAATPVTDILALAALDVVPAALVRAHTDGDDLEARTVLALHSWLMGYNLAHASTCLPHRMQYAVAMLTDASHQAGLAALYPAWARLVASRAPERLQVVTGRIAGSLGVSATDPESVLRSLLTRIGLRISLRDLGIAPGAASDLAAAVGGRIDLDPVQPTGEDIRRLFADSMES